MIKNISAVILAGGASKRFGGTVKPKILIDGKPIISRIIDTIGEIFEEIIIITNTPEEYLCYRSCRITGDQFLNKGPLSGIHSAMKESKMEALFVFAGDMPLLDKDYILSQTAFFRKSNCDIIIPQTDDNIEPLHGIYRNSLRSILEEYLKADNDYAIREFLKVTNVCFMKIEGSLKSRNAFSNINSPSDVTRVNKLLGVK
jgi:molybdopterin-guanine dinucleotide biosynthesis protein A